jgi:uncharacterized membrane protein
MRKVLPYFDRELKCILAIQLVMLVLTGLYLLNLDILIMRQVVGFVYLSLVPGFLILRILKPRDYSRLEILVYSVGLSLAFIMFLGLFVNTLYPHIGISKPISTIPITMTMVIVTIILSLVTALRSRGILPSTSVNIGETMSPPFLLLILLPFLSALGAYLATFYENNVLLLALMVIISVIVALIAFGKFIPSKLYPLAVGMIAVALLFHYSLISTYLIGADVFKEYYFQKLVIENALWNPGMSSIVNSMLSITMLSPVYSLLTGIDSVWVFKIVFMLLFACLPLALFKLYREQTNDKIAFLSVFLFMSFVTFWTSMTSTRQAIAEIFLALLILLALDKRTSTSKMALMIIFAAALVTSHYGTSYAFIILLILVWLSVRFVRTGLVTSLWQHLRKRYAKSESTVTVSPGTGQTFLNSPFSGAFICLFIVLAFLWYINMASGATFNTVVLIGSHIYEALGEFLDPTAREAATLLAVGLGEPNVVSIQRHIFQVIQYITQLFIVLGFLGLLVGPKKMRNQGEYLALAFSSLIILLIYIVVPYSAAMGIYRIYHIMLIILSPLCILGAGVAFKAVTRLSQKTWRLLRANSALSLRYQASFMSAFIPIILIPYFLFNAGFIYQVTNDVPGSLPLNLGRVDRHYFNKQEIRAAEWLADTADRNSIVYVDYYRQSVLRSMRGHRALESFSLGDEAGLEQLKDQYIYLGAWNITKGEWAVTEIIGRQVSIKHVSLEDMSALAKLINSKGRIYDNGKAQVLK